MKQFKDRTAVITGGASGIGLAIAERCAQRGMVVILADIERDSLEVAVADINRRYDGQAIGVPADVSKLGQADALAEIAFAQFGKVQLLFNNAGVAAGSGIWQTSASDWQWVMGVNFGGVLNGVRAFVPRLLAQGEAAHIVNTASVGGLISYHPSATYQVSKHAVVALSEHLYHSLSLKRANIGVSVLCPGWVKTRILEAERNRPQGGEVSEESEEERIVRERFERAVEEGMTPEHIADITFEAIERGQFYILPDKRWNSLIDRRNEDLLAERNPSSLSALSSFLGDNQVMARLVANHWKGVIAGWYRKVFRKGEPPQPPRRP